MEQTRDLFCEVQAEVILSKRPSKEDDFFLELQAHSWDAFVLGEVREAGGSGRLQSTSLMLIEHHGDIAERIGVTKVAGSAFLGKFPISRRRIGLG